jgi:hypothetical protein
MIPSGSMTNIDGTVCSPKALLIGYALVSSSSVANVIPYSALNSRVVPALSCETPNIRMPLPDL